MKINFDFNFNLTGIVVLLFVAWSSVLIVLKAVGAAPISWFQIFAPLGVVCALFFLPALIIYIWDNYFS